MTTLTTHDMITKRLERANAEATAWARSIAEQAAGDAAPDRIIDDALKLAAARERQAFWAQAAHMATGQDDPAAWLQRHAIRQLLAPLDDTWSGRTANPVNRTRFEARQAAARDLLELLEEQA